MLPYLVVIRGQLVETLLDDMVPIEVLDQNDDVKAKRDDDGMDLGGTMGVTLREERKKVSFWPVRSCWRIEPVSRWPRNQSSFGQPEFHACSEIC